MRHDDEHSDEDLFREAMGDVQPLKHKRVALNRPLADDAEGHKLRREFAEREETPPSSQALTLEEVPAVAPRDFVDWKKDGVQDLVVDRLRTGKYEIQDFLDLHGERVVSARDRFDIFLQRAYEQGKRCVLIAHGRGEASDTPARLKSYVTAWLKVHDKVNAFTSADRHNGGTGAVFVLLKKSPAARELTRELHGLKSDLNTGSAPER